MSAIAERRAANNRSARHEALIAAEVSPRAALRRAVEWVMSEARQLDTAEVRSLTDDMRRVARMLNERNRP